MNIVLTGGTGFIGKNFVRFASENGSNLCLLGRNNNKIFKSSKKIEYQKCDLNEDSFDVNFKKYEVFIHFAAYGVKKEISCWDDYLKINVISALKLFERAFSHGIKKFILIGSCFEYGETGDQNSFIESRSSLLPQDAYSATKAATSVLLHGWAIEKKIKLKILRLFSVYGEGEGEHRLYPSLIKAAKENKDYIINSGDQIRDFINVKDVVSAIYKELTFIEKEVYPYYKNIGNGKPKSVKEFAENIWMENNACGKLIINNNIDKSTNNIKRYVAKL